MTESTDVWAGLAAPLRPDQIKFRKQGKEEMAYIDGRDVIERFNAVAPGQWEFRWELVNISQGGDWTTKGTMTVCGVTHEDVGFAEAGAWGGPQKASVSDCLKRCAVHFGFAIELYQESTAALKRKAGGKGKPAEQPKPAPQRASKPKPTQPAASEPPPWTEGKSDEDKPHWIDKPKARAAFWAYTKNELGLTPIEVHEALGVESVKDYTGTMEQAKERLDVYADEKSGQEQEPLFPPAA